MTEFFEFAKVHGIWAAFCFGMLTCIAMFLKALFPLTRDWFTSATEYIKVSTAAQATHLELHEKVHEKLDRIAKGAHLAGAELIDAVETMMTPEEHVIAAPYLLAAKRALRGNGG